MSYDPKCHDLAAVFLLDAETADEAEYKRAVHELAQHIQDAIEAFIEEWHLSAK
jgi:hypothetical protein